MLKIASFPKNSSICLAVLPQITNVTDRRTDRIALACYRTCIQCMMCVAQ